jgi:hypothetical protein
LLGIEWHCDLCYNWRLLVRHILIGEFAVSRTIVIGKGVHLALRASDARDIIIIGGGGGSGGGCGGGSSIVSSIHAAVYTRTPKAPALFY